jgi:hypothetical protein
VVELTVVGGVPTVGGSASQQPPLGSERDREWERENALGFHRGGGLAVFLQRGVRSAVRSDPMARKAGRLLAGPWAASSCPARENGSWKQLHRAQRRLWATEGFGSNSFSVIF